MMSVPVLGGWFEKAFESGIQESVFNLTSIFGSPAKRWAAAQPGVKWHPSPFPSLPVYRAQSLEPVALDTQHQTLATLDTQTGTLNAIAILARYQL